MSGSAGIPLELAREIERQAELRLESTKDIAAITVARATTVSGIFGAAAVALIAALLAYVGADHPKPRLILAGAVTASLLLIASGLATFASASRRFRAAGSDPVKLRNWCWDAPARRWRSEEQLLDALAQKLAGAIDENRRLLEKEGLLLNISLWVALASLLAGIAVFFI